MSPYGNFLVYIKTEKRYRIIVKDVNRPVQILALLLASYVKLSFAVTNTAARHILFTFHLAQVQESLWDKFLAEELLGQTVVPL